MPGGSLAIIPGTLDVLILRAVAGTPRHGYGIVEFLREASNGTLTIVEGALYQALHRLEHQGYLTGSWGASENNRRAKYYGITSSGRRHLASEAVAWQRYSLAMNAVLGFA